MTMRVVIVDDEKPARDRIRRLLADHPDFEIVGEAADALSAARLIDSERPDLCFLDVQMPEGGGFETLRRIRHRPRLIFTTAYEQYAVRAFEVSSLDYVLKPFDRKRFAAALARAREAARQDAMPAGEIVEILRQIRDGLPRAADEPAGSGPEPGPAAAAPEATAGRIAGRRAGKIYLLEPPEILWFEAEDTLVFARTVSGRHLVNRTLAELEDGLSAAGFFRAHRRYLVNLSRIAEIRTEPDGGYRIVLRDEASSTIPLSRRQARRLREIIPW